MSFEGPAPIRLDIAGLATTGLRPGMSMQTRVQGEPGQLFLNVQGARIPLDAGTGLQAGQTVRVALIDGTPRPTLQVSLVVPATPAADRTPPLDRLLAPVLARLGALDASALAPRLLPTNLPPAPDAMRNLLALFFTKSEVAVELRNLAALLAEARSHGLVPESTTQFFAARAGLQTAQSAPEFRRLLGQEGSALETRIARAIAEGRLDTLPALLHDSLRGEILLLRQDTALLAHLRSGRKLAQFEDATQRILERLGGGDLQRLRMLETPYHFIELHLPPESGILRAQVHFFDDAPPGNAADDSGTRSVVLDLDLSRLGALWVTLRHTERHCSCQFESAESSVRDAIASVRQEMIDALMALGYRSVQVTATAWNGNRGAALAGLMDRFGGLNVNV